MAEHELVVVKDFADFKRGDVLSEADAEKHADSEHVVRRKAIAQAEPEPAKSEG